MPVRILQMRNWHLVPNLTYSIHNLIKDNFETSALNNPQ